MKRNYRFLCIVLTVLLLVSACGGLFASAAVIGDIDGNGEYGLADYMMVKRYVLGTYELSEEQLEAADANSSGAVDAMDYMIIKRVILGTHTLSTYSFVERGDAAYDVAEGVHYSEYTLSSGIYKNVYVSASALEFNTEDYAVIAYAGAAGGAAYLANQYRLAVEDGYDVVGAINGSFFSMDGSKNGNYGYLNEYLISNGEIYSADNDNPASDFDGMVCINSDGTIQSVENSRLHFDLYINGQSISGGISYVNKTGGRYNGGNWGNGIYYYDEHSGDLYYDSEEPGEIISAALTFPVCPGYEVLCRKLDGTKLTVGGTLEGEVISVTPDTYNGAIGENEFILFVKTASPNAAYLADLKAGDTISIAASETASEAGDVTANAQSVIANVGYLVKDGVDLTKDNAFNSGAAHSNTTKARWTAFGIKADGSWVFFTTEGASTGSDGSVTLQDVAKAMIEMGCVDVIRMDGGGSSGMYVCDTGNGEKGFKQYSGRSIGDCLLVVKRSSPALQTGEELAANVADLIEKAELRADDEYVATALAYAKDVVASDKSVVGDYKIAYMKLRYALSGKKQLGDLMSAVAGVSYKDYSEYVLTNLRAAYTTAAAAFGGDASTEDVLAAYDELKKWYELKGDVTIDGVEYKTVTQAAYVTGLNLSILTGYCSIYTPGTNVSGVNLNWAQVALLQYDEAQGAYVVKQNFFGNGQPATIMGKLGFDGNIVPEGYLVIGAHGDSGSDAANRDFVKAAGTGKKCLIYGIDLENCTIGVGAYITFE